MTSLIIFLGVGLNDWMFIYKMTNL